MKLTEARFNALLDVRNGFLLRGERLYSAAWLLQKGLIEPAPSYKPNDPVAKRAFVLTDSGLAALQEARG